MADLALQEKSKGELVKTLENDRKRRRLAAVAERAKRVPRIAFGTIIATAGGAAAGVLDAKYPSIKGTVLSGADLAAAAAILGGIAGSGDLADQAVELGQGLLAGDAAIRTHQHWLSKK